MTQMFAPRASDTVSIAPAVVFQPAHTHGSQSNVNSFAGQRGDRAYAVSSGPRNGRAALRSKEARANSRFVLLWRPDIFTAGSGAAHRGPTGLSHGRTFIDSVSVRALWEKGGP